MAKIVKIQYDRKNDHFYYVNPRDKRERIVSDSVSLLRKEIKELGFEPKLTGDAHNAFAASHPSKK